MTFNLSRIGVYVYYTERATSTLTQGSENIENKAKKLFKG